MQTSQQGISLIENFEKIAFAPYVDMVGVWTVGWGHAMSTPAGQLIDQRIFGAVKAEQFAHAYMQSKFGSWVITAGQADYLLKEDLASFEHSVTKCIGEGNATQAQFDALISFCFNVGAGNFNSSAVKRLHEANIRQIGTISMHDLYGKAVSHADPVTMPIAFARWSNAGGKFSLGLFRRRIAEMLLYSGWDATRAYQTGESFSP